VEADTHLRAEGGAHAAGVASFWADRVDLVNDVIDDVIVVVTIEHLARGVEAAL